MTSYRYLRDGESVVVDIRPHGWCLVRPALVLCAAIAGAVAALVYDPPRPVVWLTVTVLAACALWLVARYLTWAGTRLILTDRRLVERRGVLSRRGRDIPLPAVTDVSHRQSLAGRIIGMGDLSIESAGRDGREVFPGLPHPTAIRDRIREQLAKPGIADQIDQIDQLRRRGLLTEQEFTAKKSELLRRL